MTGWIVVADGVLERSLEAFDVPSEPLDAARDAVLAASVKLYDVGVAGLSAWEAYRAWLGAVAAYKQAQEEA